MKRKRSRARPIEDEMENKPQLNENLFKTVDSLELSVRAANCLENANIKYIGELVTKSEAEMLKTKNFGREVAERDKGYTRRDGAVLRNENRRF